MTPEFASRSFMIIRSSMIIFGMVVGMSISTNAETVKVMDRNQLTARSSSPKPTGWSGAGAPGYPAGLPSGEWAVGADKRDCKQTDARISRGTARVVHQRDQGVAACHPVGATATRYWLLSGPKLSS